MGKIGAGIGGLLGGAAGGLAGSLFGGPEPKLKKAGISDESRAALDDLRAKSERSQDEFAAEANEGLQSGDVMLGNAPDQAAAETALGGANSMEMTGALQARMKKRFGADINRMQRQNQITAFDRKRQYQNTVKNLDMQKKQIDLEMEAKQRMYEKELEANRNQVLSSVLGTAGSFIGSGLAGGGKTPVPSGASFDFSENSDNLSGSMFAANSSGPSMGRGGN